MVIDPTVPLASLPSFALRGSGGTGRENVVYTFFPEA
jgi:hypothetical protein